MPRTAQDSATGMEEDLYCPLANKEYKLDCCWFVNAAAIRELKCRWKFDAPVEFEASDVQKRTATIQNGVGSNVHVGSIYLIIWRMFELVLGI